MIHCTRSGSTKDGIEGGKREKMGSLWWGGMLTLDGEERERGGDYVSKETVRCEC